MDILLLPFLIVLTILLAVGIYILCDFLVTVINIFIEDPAKRLDRSITITFAGLIFVYFLYKIFTIEFDGMRSFG